MRAHEFWKSVRHLTRQSAIPIVIAALYAVWVYFSKGNTARATDAISAFGAAFFFCMWLVGQFFRASKQLSDADNFSRLSASIEDINKSISELRATPPSLPAAAPSSHLLEQARRLVQSGSVFAGLLQAGVAFEQAVHAKAQRMGLNRQDFRTFPRLLQRIEEQLGPGARTELQTLWKFRNQIVHADAEASAKLQQRPELIDYFESGIRMLGPDGDAF